VQTDPREDVLSRDEVLVIGLVHVPEDGDAGHGASLFTFMLKALDRYLLREMVVPLVLGLVVLTFLLQVQPFMLQSQLLLARGVPWTTILSALYMLLPQALSVTIPMAVLLGILVGFGRLAADREFVAMQACGVSVIRLLRPVVLVAALGTAATAYETIVALPDAKPEVPRDRLRRCRSRARKRREAAGVLSELSNHVIYVRDLPPGAAGATCSSRRPRGRRRACTSRTRGASSSTATGISSSCS